MNPTHHDLIVVGGGPAGSTAAAIAARAGLDVLLLEAGEHPRVHVGESLLPGIIPVLEEMGALEEVEAAGFGRKTGTTHWNWGHTPTWDLWFYDSDAYDHAWLVDRARFDEILFRAAERAGAKVQSGAAVQDLIWENDRLVGVRVHHRGEQQVREARARFVVDASGQTAVIARALDLRTMIAGLQHQAFWAHFEGTARLPAPRQEQGLFIAEKSHWIWFFPFPEGKASIGFIRLDGDATAPGEELFDATLRASKQLMGVIGEGARRSTPVRRARDWSYRMSRVCGPGWILCGDASGFIDPVLSSGVFLAMHAGFHAARAVAAVVRGRAQEAKALAAYQEQHATMFTDMLRMVQFFYKQTVADDYFWESKRIVLSAGLDIKPQRAFLVLTSGLVRNLALEEKRDASLARRSKALEEGATNLDEHDPDSLCFVCFHLRYGPSDASLYFLIEPRDPASPARLRTPSFDMSCIAPQLKTDAFDMGALASPLGQLGELVTRLDDRPREQLASFWRRTRDQLTAALRSLPPDLSLVRVFGE